MPMTAYLPPVPPAIVCSISAAYAYGLPANILLAVADMEAGRPWRWVRNKNGTYDVGTMQFNTAYLKTLEQYGITSAAVADDSCYPYQLAAWRVRKHIQEDSGDLWTRVANYHSRTAKYNTPYRAGLIRQARSWARWLAAHFKTFEMSSPLATASITRVAETGPSARSAWARPSSSPYVPRTITIRDSEGVVNVRTSLPPTIKDSGDGEVQ